MEAISLLHIDVDQDALQTRVDQNTHTIEDQVYLLAQVAFIAVGTMMEMAMQLGTPEAVAPDVADCMTILILAAPKAEREEMKSAIMGKRDQGV